MSLSDLIQGKSEPVRFATATPATFATNENEKRRTVATVATVATVTVAKSTQDQTALPTFDEETAIRAWLFKIGEPEEDHHIVLDKCRNNPEALAYFLKHARGEIKE